MGPAAIRERRVVRGGRGEVPVWVSGVKSSAMSVVAQKSVECRWMVGERREKVIPCDEDHSRFLWHWNLPRRRSAEPGEDGLVGS